MSWHLVSPTAAHVRRAGGAAVSPGGRGGGGRRRTRATTAAFAAGLATIALALDSPLDGYADQLFWVHMLQHVLLLTVAPPLILLGRPWPRMWRALPLDTRSASGAESRARARGTAASDRAAVARVAAVQLDTVLLAHAVAYDATLRFGWVHQLEHAMFFFTGLLFWARVIDPGPLRPKLIWPGRIAYAIGAMVVGWGLAIALVLALHPLYSHYASLAHRPGGISALTDQQLAGGMMWVRDRSPTPSPSCSASTAGSNRNAVPVGRSLRSPSSKDSSMRPLVLADNFLAGSILSWLLPVGLLIAIAIWYAIGIRRFAGSLTPDEIRQRSCHPVSTGRRVTRRLGAQRSDRRPAPAPTRRLGRSRAAAMVAVAAAVGIGLGVLVHALLAPGTGRHATGSTLALQGQATWAPGVQPAPADHHVARSERAPVRPQRAPRPDGGDDVPGLPLPPGVPARGTGARGCRSARCRWRGARRSCRQRQPA